MTGGYVLEDDADGNLGLGEAAPLRTVAGFVELETTGQGLRYGLFAGYFANLGSGETLDFTAAGPDDPANVFARGANIDHGWRVAPRLVYDAGKVRFGFELPIDTVLYASALDPEFAPDPLDDDESVTNVRADFSVFLFF
mgnify:CR=1 FL=1